MQYLMLDILWENTTWIDTNYSYSLHKLWFGSTLPLQFHCIIKSTAQFTGNCSLWGHMNCPKKSQDNYFFQNLACFWPAEIFIQWLYLCPANEPKEEQDIANKNHRWLRCEWIPACCYRLLRCVVEIRIHYIYQECDGIQYVLTRRWCDL